MSVHILDDLSYVPMPKELGIEIHCQGIYININAPRIRACKADGILEFGLGDTRVDSTGTIADRQISLSSSKNPDWQQFLLDTIPNPGYRDYALHKKIRQDFAWQLPNPKHLGRRSELFKVKLPEDMVQDFIATDDFTPIREWLVKHVRACASALNPEHIKGKVTLRNIQDTVEKRIIKGIAKNGIDTNFVCELAARLGKTILFLHTAKTLNKRFGHKAMFVMAYGVGLSVKTSYANEIARFQDFANMVFVDNADADAEKQYKKAIKQGLFPVVFISLNQDEESNKLKWIGKVKDDCVALLEETDFGTHTDSQVSKMEMILANKSVTRINSSGTNIGRIAKAMGNDAINEVISIPYSMVEQDTSINDVVLRKFYNMRFSSKLNEKLEGFDEDVLPNMKKILEKSGAQEQFLKALFQDIYGYQPMYGLNINDASGELINHSMIFANITKNAMKQLAKVIEVHCKEHKVLILNGEFTDNKSAEGDTFAELVKLRNGFYPGRDKLIVLTNMMGTRSYSVPQIQACLFLTDGGDVYPFMQKYSRCLTPGCGKTHGHIFDFGFDTNKTRNTEMSIAVEAAIISMTTGASYPDSIRKVMNSVNIMDMMSGKWLDADDIIKKFEDTDRLLEVANTTRFNIEDLSQEQLEILLTIEDGPNGSNSTGIKNTVKKVGKTFEQKGNLNSGTRESITKKIKAAIRAINNGATSVSAFVDFKEDTFEKCLKVISKDTDLDTQFKQFFGITSKQTLKVLPLLHTHILDIVVQSSQKGGSMRHATNTKIGVLGEADSKELWTIALNRREIKRKLNSSKTKKILLPAVGYGTIIEVLVELYGKDVVKKITAIDKYSCFTNDIKRRYPEATVIQGDFLEMNMKKEFDVCLMNPPYTEGTKLLYRYFFEEGLELADTVLSVMPVDLNSNYDSLKQVNYLIKKHNTFISDNVSGYFNVGQDNIHYVIASKDIENEVITTYEDPLESYEEILIDRKRLDPVKGNTDVSDNKNTDENGIEILDKVYSKGEAQYRKVNADVVKKAPQKTSSKFTVFHNHTPSNGKLNVCMIEDFNSNSTWSMSVFAYYLDSREEANKLKEWLESDIITQEIIKMQNLKNTYGVSLTMLRKLPWYE